MTGGVVGLDEMFLRTALQKIRAHSLASQEKNVGSVKMLSGRLKICKYLFINNLHILLPPNTPDCGFGQFTDTDNQRPQIRQFSKRGRHCQTFSGQMGGIRCWSSFRFALGRERRDRCRGTKARGPFIGETSWRLGKHRPVAEDDHQPLLGRHPAATW